MPIHPTRSWPTNNNSTLSKRCVQIAPQVVGDALRLAQQVEDIVQDGLLTRPFQSGAKCLLVRSG